MLIPAPAGQIGSPAQKGSKRQHGAGKAMKQAPALEVKSARGNITEHRSSLA
jgi:hypothetical protein